MKRVLMAAVVLLAGCQATDGPRYDGEVRDGKRHGQGVYEWPDGDRYEGEWREDKRHGQGVNEWPDGTRYEGEWRDGVFVGE